MGAMTAIFNKVGNAMNSLSSRLPSFNVDQSLFPKSLLVLKPYLEGANKVFPIKETLFVLGILCAYALALFIFWSIQRIINLMRGAG